ncbi:hypothetical protein [Cupriavidus oxalaticus]|uniref:Uncharacterized protein n=1 Tax=Cupriavidus oxalaticus TaxID=96344 RepID=A0A4P7LJH2_9BURK|nr:hypothetical protein [Cupriavidus oxalaticus]QBY56394.1 hypothetical protein E0W60_35915 [Cupriavidus oxalaticus]
MTRLIKVTFSATSGEELHGRAEFERTQGLVTLPQRLLAVIEKARAEGEGFEIVAHDNGYRFPLIHHQAATYRMDKGGGQRDGFFYLAWKAIIEPSKDQRQQYGRFAHTLSAAALIGLVGYFKTVSSWSLHAAADVCGLLMASVVLFVVGAVLSKGD